MNEMDLQANRGHLQRGKNNNIFVLVLAEFIANIIKGKD